VPFSALSTFLGTQHAPFSAPYRDAKDIKAAKLKVLQYNKLKAITEADKSASNEVGSFEQMCFEL